MRLKNIKGASQYIEDSPYVITDPKNYRGKWQKVFANNNEIHVEIGMGRGDFIIQMALKNPSINYIGIEKYASAMYKAIKKIENKNISNLKLINIDAILVDEIFNKEIGLIYLNFSDPWPKARHHKRRLTSEIFLSKYDKIFKSRNVIILRTDNEALFSYSLVSLSGFGYIIKSVELDFHRSVKYNGIMTEYENKFSSLGYKIMYLECEK